jgi:ankyrin repeat protein
MLKNKDWNNFNKILILGFDYYKNEGNKVSFKRALPKDYPIDSLDSRTGKTMLIESIEKGDTRLFESLLNAGVNFNTPDRSGKLPIDLILDEKKQKFLEISTKYESLEKDFASSLMTSISKGDFNTFSFILGGFENDSAKNNIGNYNLDNVVKKIILETWMSDSLMSFIENALKYDVKILQKNIGETIQVYAESYSSKFDAVAWEAVMNNKKDVVNFLNKNGVRFDLLASYDGSNPLHFSVKHNMLEMTKELVNCGVSLDKMDFKGQTPLKIAKAKGFSDISKFLESESKNKMPTSKRVRKHWFSQNVGKTYSKNQY